MWRPKKLLMIQDIRNTKRKLFITVIAPYECSPSLSSTPVTAYTNTICRFSIKNHQIRFRNLLLDASTGLCAAKFLTSGFHVLFCACELLLRWCNDCQYVLQRVFQAKHVQQSHIDTFEGGLLKRRPCHFIKIWPSMVYHLNFEGIMWCTRWSYR